LAPGAAVLSWAASEQAQNQAGQGIRLRDARKAVCKQLDRDECAPAIRLQSTGANAKSRSAAVANAGQASWLDLRKKLSLIVFLRSKP
jgi:hypothetical protein